MIKVGITGGIGSGKSLVCEVFRTLGTNVYKADEKAKILMDTDPLIKEKLMSKFGTEIYKNNKIDRRLFASIIFEDTTAMLFVNSIVHPAVAIDFHLWSSQYSAEPYVLEEAALLYESGAYTGMDKMVTVYAPEELRIKRAVLRDKSTVVQIKQRMKNQLSDEEKMNRSDFVIYNDDKHSLIEQVLNLHHIFLSSNK